MNLYTKIAIVSAIAVMPVSGRSQVLDPPISPSQTAVTAKLKTAIESGDLRSYSSLLSDDLRVYDDAKLIASGKASWLKRFAPKLTAKGVSFRVVGGYTSTGRVVFIENFNSTGSWGTDVPAACCITNDITGYKIAEGKVTEIYNFKGGEAITPLSR